MLEAEFSEAEMQLLIALIELAQPIETPNNNSYRFYPKTLAEAATYFRCHLEPWDDACRSLTARGLVRADGMAHVLTDVGIAAAHRVRAARPPIYYWYREFYVEATASPAYGRFCMRLYGSDLCQAGFTDVAQLQLLLDATRLGPTSRVLDLGCGTGVVAEHISDATGAFVCGLDYVPEAIALAQTRTRAKGECLTFRLGDLNALDEPPGSFDTIIAIDSLYMAHDLAATVQRMGEIVGPTGQMALLYSYLAWDAPSRTDLQAERTPLAVALRANHLPFRAYDLSADMHDLMQRKYRLGQEMRDEFVAEGRAMLYEHIIAESDRGTAPFDPATSPYTRYLYHVCRPLGACSVSA